MTKLLTRIINRCVQILKHCLLTNLFQAPNHFCPCQCEMFPGWPAKAVICTDRVTELMPDSSPQDAPLLSELPLTPPPLFFQLNVSPFRLRIFNHSGGSRCQLGVTGQAQSSVAPTAAGLLAEATVEKHGGCRSSKKRAARLRRGRKPQPCRPPRPLHFQQRNDKNTGWHKICTDAISGRRQRRSQMEPRPTRARLKLVHTFILTT